MGCPGRCYIHSISREIDITKIENSIHSDFGFIVDGTTLCQSTSFKNFNACGLRIRQGAEFGFYLSDCTFKYDIQNERLLVITKDTQITPNNLSFLTKPGYNQTSVAKTVDMGYFTFSNYSPVNAPDKEYDNFNRLDRVRKSQPYQKRYLNTRKKVLLR